MLPATSPRNAPEKRPRKAPAAAQPGPHDCPHWVCPSKELKMSNFDDSNFSFPASVKVLAVDIHQWVKALFKKMYTVISNCITPINRGEGTDASNQGLPSF